MANNCLVTKLKGVVNNDNLPYLNCLRCTVGMSSTGTTPSIYNAFNIPSNIQIHVLSGSVKFINEDNTESEVISAGTTYANPKGLKNAIGECVLDIVDFANCRYFGLGGRITMNKTLTMAMKYMGNSSKFQFVYHNNDHTDKNTNDLVDNVDNLLGDTNTVLNSLDLEHCPNLSGNLTSILSYAPNLERLYINDTGIEGSLRTFAHFEHIQVIDIAYNLNITDNTIEDLVEEMVDVMGKTTGSLTFRNPPVQTTFEGNLVTNQKYLNWNGKDDITFTN